MTTYIWVNIGSRIDGTNVDSRLMASQQKFTENAQDIFAKISTQI